MQQKDIDREKKYQLLQSEIIDCGHDPLEFQVFCEQLKKDGSDDIDAWDYNELVDTVKQFKFREQRKSISIGKGRVSIQKQPIQNSQFQTPTPGDDEEQKPQIQQQQYQQQNLQQQQQQQVQSQIVNKSQFLQSKFIDEGNFTQDVVCQQPLGNQLTNFIQENPKKMVDILMIEFAVKQEGLFSTGYGAFKVETIPLGWSVWRRYSDFVWLRSTLQKAYPLQLIPPISKKKIKVKPTDSIYLQKRMKVLELFLQNCLNHKILKYHPAFCDFLQMQDDAKFKERINIYDKQIGPQKPVDYVTLEGTCVLEISDRTKRYSLSLQDYLKNSCDQYHILGQNLKKLFVDLDTISNTLLNLQNNFSNLGKVTEQFCKVNEQECGEEIHQINAMYNEMFNLMNGWHNGTIFQMKNVKENFVEFFRYHKKMQEQAVEYLNQKNQIGNQYQNLKQKLNERKEKLFNAGDMNKWDISTECNVNTAGLQHNKQEAFKWMLQNETRIVDQSRDNYAFINKQLIDEINQLMGFRSKVYCGKLQRIAQMRALETAKLHHVLADFLQNIMEIAGQQSGSLQRRSASIYVDQKYDQFFGTKLVRQNDQIK